MRFFTVRDLRSTPKEVWDTLNAEKEVVITNNGKLSALMIPICDTNFEEVVSAVRQVNVSRAVTRMQMAAVQAGVHAMSLEDINAEIAAARRESGA